MQYLSFIAFVIIIVGLVLFLGRARRRQTAGQAAQAERIDVGTDVMTTSGLYGTVVAKHDDGTVALSIAPGLEVRWELAALRDASSLPPNVGGGLRDSPGADSPDADRGRTGWVDGHRADVQSPYDPPPTGGADRP